LDSINLLFKLNGLVVDAKKKIDGYDLFTSLNEDDQQRLLNRIFNSPIFNRDAVYN
jgi:hypothetical protein